MEVRTDLGQIITGTRDSFDANVEATSSDPNLLWSPWLRQMHI